MAGGEESDGTVHAREVATNSDDSAGSAIKPLGLTLADAKTLLAAIQRHLVHAEVADYCRERRCCPRCQKQRPMKDVRARRLNSLFGTVEVRAPRFKPCRCSVTSRRTLTPVAEIMPDQRRADRYLMATTTQSTTTAMTSTTSSTPSRRSMFPSCIRTDLP